MDALRHPSADVHSGAIPTGQRMHNMPGRNVDRDNWGNSVYKLRCRDVQQCYGGHCHWDLYKLSSRDMVDCGVVGVSNGQVPKDCTDKRQYLQAIHIAQRRLPHMDWI